MNILKDVPGWKRLALAKSLWDWEPHAAQREWMLDDSHQKVAACGRRFGKTESAVMDDVTLAIAIPGAEIMNIAPTRDQVMLLFQPAKRLIEQTPELQGAKIVASPHPEIHLGGSIIRYRTSGEDGKNIRGHRAHRIRVDEAAYVKSAVVSAVLEPMLMDFDGQLILQGTPFGKTWFYECFQQGLPGSDSKTAGCSAYSFPSAANPHISQSYLERMREKHGADSMHFRVEYLAEFVDSLGTVFSWDEIMSCLYDRSLAPLDRLDDFIAAIDPALYDDYSAVIIGARDRGMLYVVDWDHFSRIGWHETKVRIYDKVLEWHAKGVIDATHGSIGDPIFHELTGGEYVDTVVADGGRIRVRPGLQIEPIQFTNQLKKDMVTKLKTRISQRLIKIPTSFTDLVDELKYYGYENLESGKVRFAAQGEHKDDLVTALMMMMAVTFGHFAAQSPGLSFPRNSIGRLIDEWEDEYRNRAKMIVGQDARTRF